MRMVGRRSSGCLARELPKQSARQRKAPVLLPLICEVKSSSQVCMCHWKEAADTRRPQMGDVHRGIGSRARQHHALCNAANDSGALVSWPRAADAGNKVMLDNEWGCTGEMYTGQRTTKQRRRRFCVLESWVTSRDVSTNHALDRQDAKALWSCL